MLLSELMNLYGSWLGAYGVPEYNKSFLGNRTTSLQPARVIPGALNLNWTAGGQTQANIAAAFRPNLNAILADPKFDMIHFVGHWQLQFYGASNGDIGSCSATAVRPSTLGVKPSDIIMQVDNKAPYPADWGIQAPYSGSIWLSAFSPLTAPADTTSVYVNFTGYAVAFLKN